VKKFGLAAPPKNSKHVLQNVRDLQDKLKHSETDNSQAAGSPSAPAQSADANGDNLMNLLMGIDFNENK